MVEERRAPRWSYGAQGRVEIGAKLRRMPVRRAAWRAVSVALVVLASLLASPPFVLADTTSTTPLRYEPTAFLAGAALHHLDAVGEYAVVARGNTVESWHIPSGEARGSVALPAKVSGLSIERRGDGATADAADEGARRVVALVWTGDLSVLRLDVDGGLRLLETSTMEDLYPNGVTPASSTGLGRALLVLDGFVYGARRRDRGDPQGWSMLVVLGMARDGGLGVISETPLGEGAVHRWMLDRDRLFAVHHIGGLYGKVTSRLSVVDIERRQVPLVTRLELRLPNGEEARLAEVPAMATDGHSLWLSEVALKVPFADPNRPDALHRYRFSEDGTATRVSHRLLDRPVRALVWHGDGLLAMMDPSPGAVSELLHLAVDGPIEPEPGARTALEPGVLALAVTDEHAVVSTLDGDLLVHDLVPGAAPRRRARLGGPGPVLGVSATRGLVAVRYHEAPGTEVVLLDVVDPFRPKAVAVVPGVSNASAVALHGDLLAVVEQGPEGSALRLFDVRAPALPVALGQWTWRPAGENDTVRAIAWRSDRALVVAGAAWLGVLDVSDPRHPQPLAMWRHGMEDGDLLAVEGALAIVGPSHGARLAVQDLDAPPDRPPFVLELEPPGSTQLRPTRLALRDGRAWIAFGYKLSVHAFDLATRSSREVTRQVDIFRSPNVKNELVRIADGLLVAEGRDLFVYETSSSNKIELRQTLRMPSTARQIAVAGDLVSVAGGDGGLWMLRRRPREMPWRLALPWVGAGR